LSPYLDYQKYQLSASIIDEATSLKESLLITQETYPEIFEKDDIRRWRIQSIIVHPLKVHDEVLGFLYLDQRLVNKAFGPEDLELIGSLATQATISIQNAYLVKEMIEKNRLEEEFRLGRNIQVQLLPQEAPQVRGLKLRGFSKPAREMGGDYYDFIQVKKENDSSDDDHVSIAIGDVSGKGLDSALYMAMAKAVVYTLSLQKFSPKEILCRLNQILHVIVGKEKFLTLLYFQWNAAKDILTYSSCGHEYILVHRPKKPLSERLEVIKPGGVLLGILPSIEQFLEECELILNPQDKVILYTDGVLDAQNKNKERYGLERFKAAILTHGTEPLETMISALQTDLSTFTQDYPQYDDITMVIMEKT